jgi:hypothetical protein
MSSVADRVLAGEFHSTGPRFCLSAARADPILPVAERTIEQTPRAASIGQEAEPSSRAGATPEGGSG